MYNNTQTTFTLEFALRRRLELKTHAPNIRVVTSLLCVSLPACSTAVVLTTRARFVAGDRPSRLAEARLERTVRAERVPVLDAAARGPPAGRGRAARVADGRGPRGRLHGPHTHIPGAGGEAQGPARGRGRVQLLEGHRPVHHR